MVRRFLVPAAILLAMPAHAACAAAPAVSVSAAQALGPAPLTTTLTASGDAVAYRWELPGGVTATGPSVSATFKPGRWTVTAIGTSATGEETRATATVTAVALSLRGTNPVGYRQRGWLTGRIVPSLPGAKLVVRRDGHPAGTGTARTGGGFRIGIRPRVPGTYTVGFAGATSNAVAVAVVPRIELAVRGTPVVGGSQTAVATITPPTAGRLVVRSYRGGKLVRGRGGTGTVSLTLAGNRAGSFRVVAQLDPAKGYLGVRKLADADVRVPDLGLGSSGPSVMELARRLSAQGYALQGVNGYFGVDDMEAVLAFQKVHDLPRTGRADARLWTMLEHSTRPRALYGGNHIEVDKTRQVLYLVRDGRVALVVHVSTGATGNTPIGTFHVYRKVAGFDWVLYYPMYFLRGFAIHGYPEVPAYPASHGCVRIPMWLAPRLFADNGYGTTIIVHY
jgi:peptidoglycan hydrolase-like protein with peptidoglycan-binding domain